MNRLDKIIEKTKLCMRLWPNMTNSSSIAMYDYLWWPWYAKYDGSDSPLNLFTVASTTLAKWACFLGILAQ